MFRPLLAAVAAIATLFAAAVVVSPAAAATNLVVNGNFSSVTGSGSRQMSSNGSVACDAYDLNCTASQRSQYGSATQYVTGWVNTVAGCTTVANCQSQIANGNTTSAYNMIVTGSATSTIATTSSGNMTLDSKTTMDTQSGGGGNFLAADANYQTGMILQYIDNLVVGQKYVLTFDYAATQQTGFSGGNTIFWNTYFVDSDTGNSQNYTTNALTIGEQQFSGWKTASTLFTATNSTQILGFVAGFSAGGQPPFALLDNVSLSAYTPGAVPEPDTWAMMIVGFGAIGTMMRRNGRSKFLRA